MKSTCCLAALVLCLFFQNALSQDTISRPDVLAAARLSHLAFSASELDSMYDDLVDNLAVYKKMHELNLPNQVPMSLAQWPAVPGAKLNKAPAASSVSPAWKPDRTAKLPTNKNDLAFYSIEQLAGLLSTKQITSVALTRFFLDRLRRYADTLQCVISYTEDLAMQQARQADAEMKTGKWRGMLHGIPYGLKDLFAVKGTLTTWGAEPYKEQHIEEDAAVYEKLRSAGAVLVAKFTLGALAMGDKWYGGQTKNPWNLQRGSSGSSAGSASATVAGLVPFAIGTETRGSIISPSSACGATGLRPTFGRISRFGAMTLCWSLDKVGPICRTANDCAIVFSYLRGSDPRDGGYPNHGFNYQPAASVKSLRIGYAKNLFDRITDTGRNEWKVLRAFAAIGKPATAMRFPDSTSYPYSIIDVVILSECAAAFDGFTRSGLDDLMPNQGRNDWPNIFRVGQTVPAVAYINANRQRTLLMQAMNDVMKDFDVIVVPSFGSSQLDITNLTGHPAVSLPTGFDARRNLPTGITLLANLYDEASLLMVAKALQDATGWEDMHPAMFR